MGTTLAGVTVAVAPDRAAASIGFVLAGVALGTCSGLTPGLHVNTLALLVAGVAPALPGPPHLLGAAMLAAAVSHSVLDVVPALALGVPDPAMAVSALPGHRLVLAGRGREALRLSALGSAGAAALALPLAAPVTAVMTAVYPTLRANLTAVFAALVVWLVLTERSRQARVGAILSVAASGALGVLALDVAGPAGGPLPGGFLAPLFAGLFGAPVLVDAADGRGPPPQGPPTVETPPRLVGVTTLAGTLAGAAVGYLPGVSSAVAATVALAGVPASTGERGYLVATSGVNTANAVFALFALVALGTPRTGVYVAMSEAGVPLNLPLFLVAVVVGAAGGVLVLLAAGDRYLAAVGRLDARRLSWATLAALAAFAWAVAGPPGVVAFVAAAAVGFLPPRTGARRVHLMGVLLVPLAL